MAAQTLTTTMTEKIGSAIRRKAQPATAQAPATRGKSDRGGRFDVATYFGPDEQPAGALPGDYKVTVTKIDEPKGAFDPHKDPPPKNHLPAKYRTPQTSSLTATIKPGRNRVTLELND